jgi:hypothetical protein
MLTAVPKSWFSWDFTVMDGTQSVGDVDVSCWREKGVITVEGAHYRVYREGLMSGDFVDVTELARRMGALLRQ